jgi:hypothetical protein
MMTMLHKINWVCSLAPENYSNWLICASKVEQLTIRFKFSAVDMAWCHPRLYLSLPNQEQIRFDFPDDQYDETNNVLGRRGWRIS